MQGIKKLRVVAVVTLVAVLLAYGLPFAAGCAAELYMRQVTTRYHATQHTSTTARERGTIRSASALIVLLSICILTMVEFDMLSAAVGQPLTSLQRAEQ